MSPILPYRTCGRSRSGGRHRVRPLLGLALVAVADQVERAGADAVDVIADDLHGRGSDGKAGAASTAGRGSGIIHPERSAAQRFDKIDHTAAHQIKADCIDDQANAVGFGNAVIRFHPVGQAEAKQMEAAHG